MLVRLKEGENRDTQIKIMQTCLFKTFFITLLLITQISFYLLSLLECETTYFLNSKLIKKVIINLDSSKVCSPAGIPVVVLKKCELEFPYILAELLRSEGILFSRLLEGLICAPCIQEYWGEV